MFTDIQRYLCPQILITGSARVGKACKSKNAPARVRRDAPFGASQASSAGDVTGGQQQSEFEQPLPGSSQCTSLAQHGSVIWLPESARMRPDEHPLSQPLHWPAQQTE